MTRRLPAFLVVASLLLAAAVVVVLSWGGADGPSPAYAQDPADPAMVLDDPSPCTSPCAKSGVVFRRASSVLNPAAGTVALKLDVYRSAKTPKRDAPVVVVLFGGGFVTGDRTTMRAFAEVLARAGFLAVTPDYRLVAKDRNNGAGIVKTADLIPAADVAAQDTLAAMKYVRAHAKALGATTDKARYAVGGYSAGAITALRVALRAGDKTVKKAQRWHVGAAFAISGTECGTWSKAYGCKGAYDEADPPIAMFHGEADSIVSFTYGRDTCTAAILEGGGCQGYFYPGQDHFWSSGTIFGGGQGLTRKHPVVAPTVARFLKGKLD